MNRTLKIIGFVIVGLVLFFFLSSKKSSTKTRATAVAFSPSENRLFFQLEDGTYLGFTMEGDYIQILPEYLRDFGHHITGGQVHISKRSTIHTGSQHSARQGTWLNLSFHYPESDDLPVEIRRSFGGKFDYQGSRRIRPHRLAGDLPKDVFEFETPLSVNITVARHFGFGDQAPAGM